MIVEFVGKLMMVYLAVVSLIYKLFEKMVLTIYHAIKRKYVSRVQGARAEAEVEKVLREWIQEQKTVCNREFLLIERDCSPIVPAKKNNIQVVTWVNQRIAKLKEFAKRNQRCINIASTHARQGFNEIDHIVVGNGMVVHIETKSFGGSIRIKENDIWIRRSEGHEKEHPDHTTPEGQTNAHHQTLRAIVEQKAGVFGVICLAGKEPAVIRGDTEKLQFPIYPVNVLKDYLNWLANANNPVDRADVTELVSLIDNNKVNRAPQTGVNRDTRPPTSPAKQQPTTFKETDLVVYYAKEYPVSGYKTVKFAFYFAHKYEGEDSHRPFSWHENMNIPECGLYIIRKSALLKGKPEGYEPTVDDVISHPSSSYFSTKNGTAKYDPAKNAFEVDFEYDQMYFAHKDPVWTMYVLYRKGNNNQETSVPITFSGDWCYDV